MAGSFSFDTPEEVMHILASVRASGVSPAEQSQLRDLVLSYTNGGKDPSLKIQIEQQLQQLSVAPNTKPTSLEVGEQHDFGSSRNVPSFMAATPTPTSAQSQSQPAVPAPVAAAPAPAMPQPVAPPVPQATAPTPTPAPTQPAAAQPATTPAPAAASAPAGVDPLRRIREIKALVNEKVGNPVNLVDIDNTVGREYMAALLEAMKKLSSGGDTTSSMSRLEAAYTSVEAVLQNRTSAETSASAAPVPTSTPTPTAPQSPVQPVSQAATSAAKPAPASTRVPIQKPAAKPIEPTTPRSVPVKSSSAPERPTTLSADDSAARWANNEIRVPASVSPIREPVAPAPIQKPEPAEVVTPVTPPLPPSKPTPAPEPVSLPVLSDPEPLAPVAAPVLAEPELPPEPPKPDPLPPRPAINAAPPPAPAIDLAPDKRAVPVDAAVKPLSKTGQPLKSVSDLPTPDSLDTAADGDPLHTREVDDGLNQLLTDWVLFKKSGLLGTGPKGSGHPLYLKIKELEIPILLAGRFDGATQEIKQSITDYMNGWRYEQGIIYEQGETFEHYLRRVIRHILDLQK